MARGIVPIPSYLVVASTCNDWSIITATTSTSDRRRWWRVRTGVSRWVTRLVAKPYRGQRRGSPITAGACVSCARRVTEEVASGGVGDSLVAGAGSTSFATVSAVARSMAPRC